MGRQIALKSEIRGLQAILESQLKPRSILFVTGATVKDGASTVAQGITDMYRASGASVALVRVTDPAAEVEYRPVGRGEIQAPSPNSTRAEIESIAEAWRENFDIIVVESAPLLDNPMAPRLAAIADGTVLALAHGRQILSQDTSTAQFLDTVGAKVLGVVTTTKAKPSTNWFGRLFGRSTEHSEKQATAEPSPLFLRS